MHFGITGHSKFSPLNELVKQMIEYVQKKKEKEKSSCLHFCGLSWHYTLVFTFPLNCVGNAIPHGIQFGLEPKGNEGKNR